MGPRMMGGVRAPWLPGAWFGTGRSDARKSALGVAAVHFPGPLPLPRPRPGFACTPTSLACNSLPALATPCLWPTVLLMTLPQGRDICLW